LEIEAIKKNQLKERRRSYFKEFNIFYKMFRSIAKIRFNILIRNVPEEKIYGKTISLLDNKNNKIKFEAINQLRKRTVKSNFDFLLIEKLIANLEQTYHLRWISIIALGELSYFIDDIKKIKSILDNLLPFLIDNEKNPHLRKRMINALGMLGQRLIELKEEIPKQMIEELIRSFVKDPDQLVRNNAIWVFYRIDFIKDNVKYNEIIVNYLINSVLGRIEDNMNNRIASGWALGYLNSEHLIIENRDVKNLLLLIEKQKNQDLKKAIIFALGGISNNIMEFKKTDKGLNADIDSIIEIKEEIAEIIEKQLPNCTNNNLKFTILYTLSKIAPDKEKYFNELLILSKRSKLMDGEKLILQKLILQKELTERKNLNFEPEYILGKFTVSPNNNIIETLKRTQKVLKILDILAILTSISLIVITVIPDLWQLEKNSKWIFFSIITTLTAFLIFNEIIKYRKKSN